MEAQPAPLGRREIATILRLVAAGVGPSLAADMVAVGLPFRRASRQSASLRIALARAHVRRWRRALRDAHTVPLEPEQKPAAAISSSPILVALEREMYRWARVDATVAGKIQERLQRLRSLGPAPDEPALPSVSRKVFVREHQAMRDQSVARLRAELDDARALLHTKPTNARRATLARRTARLCRRLDIEPLSPGLTDEEEIKRQQLIARLQARSRELQDRGGRPQSE